MRLWTIQPIEVYNQLVRDGYFICDKRKSPNINDAGSEQFIRAYKWLIHQMDIRGIYHPNSAEYPIWAWHTRDWKHKKPDLRESCYDKRGTKSVCIELEIPDNQVLLSDFDEWHYVLNNWYNDASKSEEEWEKMQEHFNKLSPREKQIAIEKSWQRIFNITPFHNEWHSRGKYIQATFWQIKIENVRRVQKFTCK